MPRLKYAEGDRIGWLCCLDCGTRWVGGIGHRGRVCRGYEDEGCGSHRVVRETTAVRIFQRELRHAREALRHAG